MGSTAVRSSAHHAGLRPDRKRQHLLFAGRLRRRDAQHLPRRGSGAERADRLHDPQILRPRHADRRRGGFRRQDLHLAQQQRLGGQKRRIRRQLVRVAGRIRSGRDLRRRLCGRDLFSSTRTDSTTSRSRSTSGRAACSSVRAGRACATSGFSTSTKRWPCRSRR